MNQNAIRQIEVMMNMVLTRAEIKDMAETDFDRYCKLFGEDYFEKNAHEGYQGYRWNLQNKWLKPRLDWLAYNHKIELLLDVGCAYGYSVQYARNKLGLNAYGIDVSKWAVSQVPTDTKAYVIQASATNIPFDDDYFDSITCFDMMEHIPENKVDQAFKEIFRVTCNLAYFCISTHKSDFTHVTVHDTNWWINKLRGYGKILSCPDGILVKKRVS